MTAVSVRLGPALYGIDVERVQRVVRSPAVSRVPFAPRDVVGVTQVGGSIVAVLDLGTRLGGAPAAAPGRLVLVRARGSRETLALRVDGVGGLVETDAAAAAPAEADAALPEGWLTGVVEGTGGRRVALLDIERVLRGGDE